MELFGRVSPSHGSRSLKADERVKPQTVISWHRAGFRLFWRFSIPKLESLLTSVFAGDAASLL
jgi:hypothetical protein